MSVAFWGAAGGMNPPFELTDKNQLSFALDPTNAVASFTLYSDGRHSLTSSNAGEEFFDGEWQFLQGVFPGSDYEVRATAGAVVGGGGNLTGDAVGSWLSLGTTRSWTITTTTQGFISRSFFVEIRRVSTGLVVADATIELAAERVV